MKKYRVNTTISSKHQEILTKYAEEYGTQQKVLEHALEGLNDNSDQFELDQKLELWMRVYRIKDLIVILPKDYTKKLFDTVDFDNLQEYIENEKPVEFTIEWYYDKPLTECTLKEIVRGITLNLKIQSLADSLNCTDHGNHYTINIAHGFGINGAKIIEMMNKNVFKSYGAQYDSYFSERSVFFKIFKN